MSRPISVAYVKFMFELMHFFGSNSVIGLQHCHAVEPPNIKTRNILSSMLPFKPFRLLPHVLGSGWSATNGPMCVVWQWTLWSIPSVVVTTSTSDTLLRLTVCRLPDKRLVSSQPAALGVSGVSARKRNKLRDPAMKRPWFGAVEIDALLLWDRVCWLLLGPGRVVLSISERNILSFFPFVRSSLVQLPLVSPADAAWFAGEFSRDSRGNLSMVILDASRSMKMKVSRSKMFL